MSTQFKEGQKWERRDKEQALVLYAYPEGGARVKLVGAPSVYGYFVDAKGFHGCVPHAWDLIDLVCAHCGRGPGEEACDWIECAAIAPKRIYVAGPMTGYPQLNFPAFHARAAELRAQGYVVINPAEINGGADELAACAVMTPEELLEHWRKCMRRDITELCTCDGIAMLDGWTRSKGATLEHHVAKSLGLMVIEAGA